MINYKPYVKETVMFLVLSIMISFGLSIYIPFTHIFMLLLASAGLFLYAKSEYSEKPVDTKELDEKLKEYEEIIDEQISVIREYEEIFDLQLVELPCVCGGNVFKGLFSPNTENVCECEKCNSKYKVTVNYDSVLMSEPLENDAIFTSIQNKIAE